MVKQETEIGMNFDISGSQMLGCLGENLVKNLVSAVLMAVVSIIVAQLISTCHLNLGRDSC